eukprot:GHRR01009546.1.p1 GENE.GHRR01009546.1~~GHRR01009546.1.p1  ORF type:complete len:358 (+),score=102.20 GHRR01009546.1:188-1261(+)
MLVMQGVLFKYGQAPTHIAFKSPPAVQHPRCKGQLHLVLVGGLTDGLMFAPYCQQLASAVGSMGWTLVQAQLTSSYQGWGLASLDQDADELQQLAACLSQQQDCQAWVVMGHSTGCQDAIRFVQRHRHGPDSKLAGVILQAPVSDKEYLGMFPLWSQWEEPAQALAQQGKEEDVVFRAFAFDGAAVTARRFLSLFCKGGDDDMFSTDLTLQELQAILGPLQGLPCLIIQSGADEAVPEHFRNNSSIGRLGRAIVQAITLGPPGSMEHDNAQSGQLQQQHNTQERSMNSSGGASHRGPMESKTAAQTSNTALAANVSATVEPCLHVIEGAGHACTGHENELVSTVCKFLRQLPLETQT